MNINENELERTLYLGLDVHKEKTSASILEADRDAVGRMPGGLFEEQGRPRPLSFSGCPHPFAVAEDETEI